MTTRREKIADGWFSKYIRLKNSTPDGICNCITCHRPFHWKEIDCGHFVSRSRKIVRFDERNCAPQCKHCNRFKGGEQWKFGKAIDKIYGEGTATYLQGIAKRPYKRVARDLDYLIEEYKVKAKEEAKKRGIRI